jgi:hypothetical protein
MDFAAYVGPLILALLLILFGEGFARLCMDFQNRAWGYKFGDREIQGSKIVIVLGALFLILSPIHRDQSDINNYLLAGVGLLAAAGAWMLSIYKPIAGGAKADSSKPNHQAACW